MKKLISLAIAVIMILSVLSVAAFAENESFKIAIVQQLDHPSLDEIRTAVEAENRRGLQREE